jgi:hypothetical protein
VLVRGMAERERAERRNAPRGQRRRYPRTKNFCVVKALNALLADYDLSQFCWRDPSEWTGLNCSSASFSWFFLLGFLVVLSIKWATNRSPDLSIIAPGPVRCENAWYRSVTSQQRAGPEKGDCG